MKNKIFNTDLHSIYIQQIQKTPNINKFEKKIKEYYRINILTEKDYIDLINLSCFINKSKNKNKMTYSTSRRFLYFIFKNSLKIDFFSKAKISRENFLIKKMLSLTSKNEEKVFILRIIMKKYPNYVYRNFEYIKKILIKLEVINIYESKIKTIYQNFHSTCDKKKYFKHSDFFRKKDIENFIEKEKISKNSLVGNYFLLDRIIESFYLTPTNFDIKKIIKEKFDFNNTEIADINNDKINIYNKTDLEQKVSVSSYNKFTDVKIKLMSITQIMNSIFIGYKKIYNNETLRKNFVLYLQDKFKSKYNFDTKKQDLYIILQSFETFLYGSMKGILNIIPLLEKIIRNNLTRDNSPKQIFDFLHEDVFIDEWLMFKDIYIKQKNIKKVVNRNKKIIKSYTEDNDYYSFDIRNKFLHGLFSDQNDEDIYAIYTYIFLNQILDLKEFFINNKIN